LKKLPIEKHILPFTDQKVWEYLQWHSYFSMKHKLLYVSTPKVACTSLKWWFASLEGLSPSLFGMGESGESDPVLAIHDSFRKVAPTVTGLPVEVLMEPVINRDVFRFAVVRNPYRRLFSAWQSKLLLREPLQSKRYEKYDFFWMPINTIKSISQAFEEFVEHLYRREAPNFWDVHWMPQSDLLRPDLISYNFLSRIENVKKLSAALKKHLGANIPNPFNRRRVNESLLPYLPDFVSRRATQLIQIIYAKDFDTFGYDRQPPKNRDEFSNSEMELSLRAIHLIRGRHKRLTELRENFSTKVERLNTVVVVAEEKNQKLYDLLAERDNQIAKQNQHLAVHKGQISELKQFLETRDNQIAELNQALKSLDQRVNRLNGELSEREERIHLITSSRSWLMTRPYRWIGDSVRSLWGYICNSNSLCFQYLTHIRNLAFRILKKLNFIMSKEAFAFDIYKRRRRKTFHPNLSYLNIPSQQSLVSIILPVYNGYNMISEAIDSILNQTYTNFELIIVDDGSQDNTNEILARYEKIDKRIRVVNQENQKLPRALTNGFALAKGQFLTWISHDNRFKPDFLKKMIECLQRHPSWDMVYANMDIIGDDGTPLRSSSWFSKYQLPAGSEHIYLPNTTLELNIKPNNFIGGAFMYRDRVDWLLGAYNSRQYTREDYDYWMQVNSTLTLNHVDFNEPVFDYRFHSNSLTSRDKDLGITRDRKYLMVFDDFRRDFYQSPLVWFVDVNPADSLIEQETRFIYDAILRAGHIVIKSDQTEKLKLPDSWVPAVYLKISSDPQSNITCPPTFPANTVKVLLCKPTAHLPDKVSENWDMCIMHGSENPLPKLEKHRKGWWGSRNLHNLFTAIDIFARSEHLRLIEERIARNERPKYKISVIICTYREEPDCKYVLQSVADQTMPQQDYEVLVVDNSADSKISISINRAIQEVNDSYTTNNLHLISCPIIGLSFARNAGISEAKGEILLFLDDDVIVQRDLLEQYWRAYSEHPDAGVIGGHIILNIPRNLKIPWKKGWERYWSHFITRYSCYTNVENWWEFPWGANWSAKRSALLQIGGFRGLFGRRGDNFNGGEEIIAASSIQNLGSKIAILPNAVVFHHVSPNRFTLNHIKQTIRAGLFVEYYAQINSYLPVEHSFHFFENQIIENLKKMYSFLRHPRNTLGYTDFLEACFYLLARIQLLKQKLKDCFRRMRLPTP